LQKGRFLICRYAFYGMIKPFYPAPVCSCIKILYMKKITSIALVMAIIAIPAIASAQDTASSKKMNRKELREKFKKATPEQKQAAREKWQNATPEQKEALRKKWKERKQPDSTGNNK
jgi:hypothetical protein